jgi:uncharacterized repeat protein (TIGR03803 family)
LYGSTLQGGTNGDNGTVFRVTKEGTLTKLYDFNGTDGSSPSASLVVGPDGALYGSTLGGGVFQMGTLFRITADGTFTKLHDFAGTDGGGPTADLVVGMDGALFGSTPVGGSGGGGTLFRLRINGTFTKLHDFSGADGYGPSAALIVGGDGALYGATPSGGINGAGTLFRLGTNGTYTKLYDFTEASGSMPAAALVVGPDGALYGSTSQGGTNNNGTLFRLDAKGAFTHLYDFNGANGSGPSVAMVVGPNGGLYGTTPEGGASVGGILFKIVLNRPPVAKSKTVLVAAGANCTADASIDDGSSDPDGNPITFTQTPSGPYSLGTNVVILTATDNQGGSASSTNLVIVLDRTPPQLACPSDMTANCTSLNGAAVSFAPSASDDCSGPPAVVCVPPSGTTFPIGTTTVYCTATDKAGNFTWCSFHITVLSLRQMLERLVNLVNAEAARPQPITEVLNAALASLDRGSLNAAFNQLQAFQNKVRAQVASKNPSLSGSLIKAAQEIIDALSAPGTPAADHWRRRITSVAQQVNGHVQLRLDPAASMPVLIEASTNLVDWEIIGVGTLQPDGSCSFEDQQAQGFPNRYYRTKR